MAKKNSDPGLVFTRPRKSLNLGSPSFWCITIILLSSAVVFGAGMYFYQDYFYQKQVVNYQRQLQYLNEQFSLLVKIMGGSVSEPQNGVCPALTISPGRDIVAVQGIPLNFTKIQPGDGNPSEIIDVRADTVCGRLAWSAVRPAENGEAGMARVYVSDFGGTDIKIFDVSNEGDKIYLAAFDNGRLAYRREPASRAGEPWYKKLALSLHILTVDSGRIEDIGLAYSISPDLKYAVISDSGGDSLKDISSGQELAMLSGNQSDEAIDYIFSPDSKKIAYILFTDLTSADFLSGYFDYGRTEPIAGQVRIWNIAEGGFSVARSGDMAGLRLVGWKDGSEIEITAWEPAAVTKTLQLQ